MSRQPKPKPSKGQTNVRVDPKAGDRLRYAQSILPTQVSYGAILARGIELYIAEAERMKEAANG